ncbi:type A2 lantipeptide [Streptomyces sp. IBSBF 3136]|uniref:type A2 lantipeptide n=1 Tax=Streptomyces sp. IBSBF 3136 TaxID=2903524 RepID=UPI002FDC327E
MTNRAARMETTEISDAELDDVAGGLAAGGAGCLYLDTPLGTVSGDLLAVASPEGVTTGASLHATTL